MKHSGVLAGVGFTALMVAAARAAESARPDRLINDPFAAGIVTRAKAEPPLPLRIDEQWPTVDGEPDPTCDAQWSATVTYMGVRSRVFDEALLAATGSDIRQVVVFAAGLDARAFRLSWPAGTRMFELDTAEVLDAKALLIDAEPRCDRRVVPVDLRDDWPAALRAAGFDPTRPAVFLAEGLLPYLSAQAQELLFFRVDHLAAPGSRIAVEDAPNTARNAPATDILGVMGAPWHLPAGDLLPPDEDRQRPAASLAASRWTTRTLVSSEVAAGFGRTTADLAFASEFVLGSRG